MKDWDTYRDELDYDKFRNERIAVLERRYYKNGSPIKNYFRIEKDDKPDPARIVAKGISAYLCSDVVFSPKLPSLKNLLKDNVEIPTEHIFNIYFQHCINFSIQQNNKNPLPHKRKTDNELINEHLNQEKHLLQESTFLYEGDEIKEQEIEIIHSLKEVAYYYQEWVNATYNEKKYELKEKIKKIRDQLEKFELSTFLKQKKISLDDFMQLINNTSGKQLLPYTIALLYEVQFLEYFFNEHASSKEDGFRKLGKIFESNSRRIKGNVNILMNPNSKEESYQYSSPDYQSKVEKELNKLLLGR